MFRRFLSNTFVALVAAFGVVHVGNAVAAEQCPEGWIRPPTLRVCAPTSMQGSDGTFSEFVRAPSLPPRPPCPDGWIKPPGINLCVLRQITLNAAGSLPIIETMPTRFCPEGFHRRRLGDGTTICIASNLRVNRLPSGAVQVLGPASDCPIGFVRPTGSVVCVADNAAAQQADLAPPSGPRCPAGFHRPPGVSWCIAMDMVYGDTTPADQIPVGRCPKNWVRPIGSAFCIPGYERVYATAPLSVVTSILGLPCPTGTHEEWWDMPTYEPPGLFMNGTVPTRVCIPDNLEPEG